MKKTNKAFYQSVLSIQAPKDSLTWVFSKDGLYSTNTAYMLGKGGDLDNFHVAWMEIWGVEVSPRVKHFLWQQCGDTPPTRALLRHRKLMTEATYLWCDAKSETSTHAAISYSRVSELQE